MSHGWSLLCSYDLTITSPASVKSDPSSIHDPAAKVSEGAESMKKYGFVLKHPPLS